MCSSDLHELGILEVEDGDLNSLSTDMALKIDDSQIGKFRKLQPEVKAGTLVIINYSLVHQSGFNKSSRCRWSLLSRYFNLHDQNSISRGWHGGSQEGFKFREVFLNNQNF